MSEPNPRQPFDEHDRRLLAGVQPPDWIYPAPKPRYHLVVIGAGTAGLVSAAGAAALGAKVALVERHRMGGDCLNYGCVPSKALLRAARAIADVRRASEFGVHIKGEVSVDFPAIMARMRRLRADISPNDSAQRFRDLGVDVFFGAAKFVGLDRVMVGDKTLPFRRAILATGTRPDVPAIPGLAEAGYLTNESVFSLTGLPLRLAILGGGPIGCELAQAFARFGSRVLLFEKHDYILYREPRPASECIRRALERDGVEFVMDTDIRRIDIKNDGTRVLTTQRGEQQPREFEADAILVAVGRLPNTEDLGLDAAGIETPPRDLVVVNDRLQTQNPRIFAAGDVCSYERFTHAADAMARIAVQNALFYGRAKMSKLVIPRCLYTDPEVASVGYDDAGGREYPEPFDAFEHPFKEVDRANLDGETEGFVQIVVKKGTDRILRATIVSRHAGDMIGEVALAMTGKLGLKTLAKTIHPYPTHGEALRKIGDAYNRTRLTPTVRWLFDKWFRWTM